MISLRYAALEWIINHLFSESTANFFYIWLNEAIGEHLKCFVWATIADTLGRIVSLKLQKLPTHRGALGLCVCVCVGVCTFTLNCKTTNLIAQKPNKTQHDGNCVPLALGPSVCLSVRRTGCLVGWQAESVPEMLGLVEVLSCWNDANTTTKVPKTTTTTITSAEQPWTWKVKRTLPRDVKQFMEALTLIAADVQIIMAGSTVRSWNSFSCIYCC